MSIDTPKAVQRNKPTQAQGTQLRFLLNILFTHWVKMVAAGLAGAVALGAATYAMRTEPRKVYESYADLQVIPTEYESDLLRSIRKVQVIPMTPDGLVAAFLEKKERYAEEIVRALIQRDIAEGGPHAGLVTQDEVVNAVRRVADRLTVEAVPKTNLVRVRAENCDSQLEADEIAEFGARVFHKSNLGAHMDQGKQALQFLQTEVEALQERLSAAETAEWEYKREAGFRTQSDIGADLADKEGELLELEAKGSSIEAKLAELDSELTLNRQQFPESLEHVTDGVIRRLFAELDELLQEKLDMSTYREPAHPDLQVLDEQISEKQQAILTADEQLGSGIPGGSDVWQRRKEIHEQQISLRVQLTNQEISEQTIRRQLDEIIPQIPDLAERKLQADKLENETKQLRKELEGLMDQEWQLRTRLGRGTGQLERYGSVKRASAISLGLTRGRVPVVAFMGGVVAAVVAFMLILLIEYNDTSIRSIEDVNEYIGLEVLGTIPEMKFGRPRLGRRKRATYVTTVDEEQIDACIVTQHDPKSPISEAYRTLRTNFQFATLSLKPRTLMITSAVPGEGKTTTAVNLAVTMADRGLRVLIVDTDLRRPNVHRVLRMERGVGLADVLREGLNTDDVIRPTRVENLFMISSGRVPPNPSELIGSDRMSAVMKHLGDSFDLVICDAPSVLVVTDPVLLATHVDTCAMVVTAKFARRETIIRANKLLQTANVNIAGVVVNALETTRRNYYYYYYYYDDGNARARKWYHL